MKSISGKKLGGILERRGWTFMRVQGSHHIFGRTESIVRISVPIHGSKPLKIGLFKFLLKQAGLSEKDLS